MPALPAFCDRRSGERVVHPFVFSSASKSRLGWDFLSMIDSGRLTCSDPNLADDPEQQRLDRIFRDTRWRPAGYKGPAPDPASFMRWSVEDPALHDDLLISAALIAVLDGLRLEPLDGRC
ncbi:MAG: hypothetical protein R2849_00025 [Thermomicrobiales bacterium]